MYEGATAKGRWENDPNILLLYSGFLALDVGVIKAMISHKGHRKALAGPPP
jgi:hypothetical protein